MANANVIKGVVAGAVAGLIASAVMNGFQAAVSKVSGDDGSGAGEPSTEKAADRVSIATTGQRLPEAERQRAGNLAHYGFGAAMGAGYGLAAEFLPRVATGFGGAFGAGLWAVADEATVPALRLSPPPTQSSGGEHLYALTSHLVFGATTEGARRLLRRAL